MRIRFRVVALLVLGLLIFGVCAWRLSTPRSSVTVATVISDRRSAPPFELYDQQSRLVKLEAYLHRHEIVLVFFDGDQGLEQQPVLTQLRDFYPALERNGVIALAVSNALPQNIRQQSVQPFPFPILADITAGQPGSAAELWGTAVAVNAATAETGLTLSNGFSIRNAVFYIDRSGLVDWVNDRPRPVDDPQRLINSLISGRSPAE